MLGPDENRTAVQRCVQRIGSRRLAVLASIVIHVVLLYAVGQMAWSIPEVDSPASPPVMWIRESIPDVDDLLPVEELATERILDEAPNPSPTPELAPNDSPAPEYPIEDMPQGEESSGGPVVRREIDWEGERQNVIARVIEQLEQERAYRDFSTGEKAARKAATDAEAAARDLTERLFENCPVVTGKFAQFAMRMMGRCFRTAAHGDLFAHLKPAYLKWRPICAQVQTQFTAAASQPGDERPVTKCRLAPIEEFDVPAYLSR